MKFFYAILLLSGCFISCSTNEQAVTSLKTQKEKTETFYVAKHGWHTGIIIKKSSLDTIFPALTKEFPRSDYLDISWGDKKYFMAPDDNVLLALRAVLIPTRSVVRVVSVPYDPESFFAGSDVRAVDIPRKDFYRMIDYLKKTFERDDRNKLIPAGKKGIYFLSERKYWGFRTCNEWTARALKKGGFRIVPVFSLSSGSLMKKLPSEDKD
jgi:uncharacterized protein (TIGR02117 family)